MLIEIKELEESNQSLLKSISKSETNSLTTKSISKTDRCISKTEPNLPLRFEDIIFNHNLAPKIFATDINQIFKDELIKILNRNDIEYVEYTKYFKSIKQFGQYA